jgi:hypothetical protein
MGDDFVDPADPLSSTFVRWTAKDQPTVVPLAPVIDALANPNLFLSASLPSSAPPLQTPGLIQDTLGSLLFETMAPLAGQLMVLLPLDQLFDIRAAAALRLWRFLPH